jgi:hypothetical protein
MEERKFYDDAPSARTQWNEKQQFLVSKTMTSKEMSDFRALLAKSYNVGINDIDISYEKMEQEIEVADPITGKKSTATVTSEDFIWVAYFCSVIEIGPEKTETGDLIKKSVKRRIFGHKMAIPPRVRAEYVKAKKTGQTSSK